MKSHRLSIIAAAVAALALLPLAGPAVAQGIGPQSSSVTSPIPLPAAVVIRAKITGLNAQTRRITLTAPNGISVSARAGKAVDLTSLKVGDTVDIKALPLGRIRHIDPGRACAGKRDRAGRRPEC